MQGTMKGNYEYKRNGDTITLEFSSDKRDYRFKCQLELKTKYGSVQMWDRYGHGYELSIYKHVNDMLFCVMDTASKKEEYNKYASYWHSAGNLFDTDNFSLDSKIIETIDVLINLCLEQYKMFKKLK